MLHNLKGIDETLNIGIIIASDTAYGIYEDKSGIKIKKYIEYVVNRRKQIIKFFIN